MPSIAVELTSQLILSKTTVSIPSSINLFEKCLIPVLASLQALLLRSTASQNPMLPLKDGPRPKAPRLQLHQVLQGTPKEYIRGVMANTGVGTAVATLLWLVYLAFRVLVRAITYRRHQCLRVEMWWKVPSPPSGAALQELLTKTKDQCGRQNYCQSGRPRDPKCGGKTEDIATDIT